MQNAEIHKKQNRRLTPTVLFFLIRSLHIAAPYDILIYKSIEGCVDYADSYYPSR